MLACEGFKGDAPHRGASVAEGAESAFFLASDGLKLSVWADGRV